MKLWALCIVACLAVFASDIASAQPAKRSGAYGLGLGLEVPVLGISGALAGSNRPSWGYAIGGALSWEITPRILIRGFVTGGEMYRGKARVEYLESGQRERSTQGAEWFGVDTGIGAAYLFRDIWTGVSPYVGVDVGATYGGFNFQFDDSLSKLETVDLASPSKSNVHEALRWGAVVQVRGGVRLDMFDWLASQVELVASYVPYSATPISNTREAREVRGAREDVFLLRFLYSLRFGL